MHTSAANCCVLVECPEHSSILCFSVPSRLLYLEYNVAILDGYSLCFLVVVDFVLHLSHDLVEMRTILACVPANFEVNDDGREFVERAKDLVVQVDQRETEGDKRQ